MGEFCNYNIIRPVRLRAAIAEDLLAN